MSEGASLGAELVLGALLGSRLNPPVGLAVVDGMKEGRALTLGAPLIAAEGPALGTELGTELG